MSYDDAFFAQESMVALAAAEIVFPTLIERLSAKSVIDIGCGTGAWLAVAKKTGCEVLGIDGHAPEARLLIDEFERHTLHAGFPCNGFDLALCLEVAEHLPAESASALVRGLCEARYVLWSAAIPEQGGVDHVNEQWPSWWAQRFAEYGFFGTGQLRDEHWEDLRIADFYRQNLILFGRPADLEAAGYEPEADLSHLDKIHPHLAEAKRWAPTYWPKGNT